MIEKIDDLIYFSTNITSNKISSSHRIHSFSKDCDGVTLEKVFERNENSCWEQRDRPAHDAVSTQFILLVKGEKK